MHVTTASGSVLSHAALEVLVDAGGDLINQGGHQETNTSKRLDIYSQAQKIIMDQAVLMPIHENVDLVMTSKKLTGLIYSGGGFEFFGAGAAAAQPAGHRGDAGRDRIVMTNGVLAETGAPVGQRDMLLEVKHLQTHFKTRSGLVPAVDGVNFDIAAGSSVGIVGESGSDMSMTSLAIMRLIEPPGFIAGGPILFKGADVVSLPEREVPAVRGRDLWAACHFAEAS